MKKFKVIQFLILLVMISSFLSCEKEGPEVDENGLTKEVNDLVPAYIIEEMKNLGMPIHGGNKPPSVVLGKGKTTYLKTPNILLASTDENDGIGDKYNDVYFSFEKQNRKTLDVYLTKEQKDSFGKGYGAFIVGEGNTFTIFAKIKLTDEETSAVATMVDVYSGKMGKGGIEDLHTAVFMIDDDGDPDDIWIENGEGRVFYDSDAFSEVVKNYESGLRLANSGGDKKNDSDK